MEIQDWFEEGSISIVARVSASDDIYLKISNSNNDTVEVDMSFDVSEVKKFIKYLNQVLTEAKKLD